MNIAGSGWEESALVNAMGRRPDEDAREPHPDAPGIKLHVMRWRCADGGLVRAVKAPYESRYTVDTTCRHAQHVEIARLPFVRVEEISLVDGGGAPADFVPSDLKGARLRFRLTSPVKAFARIAVDPDMSAPAMMRPRIRVECGMFGPGQQPFDADLDPDGELDGPVLRDVTVSIHVLDPSTARRNPGAKGIRLWQGTYGVEPATAKA